MLSRSRRHGLSVYDISYDVENANKDSNIHKSLKLIQLLGIFEWMIT